MFPAKSKYSSNPHIPAKIAQICRIPILFVPPSLEPEFWEPERIFKLLKCPVPHCQTLIELGWPQPKLPIRSDNSTAAGFTNETIVEQRSKMMDMRFRWLRCQESQNQFQYYWDAGSKMWFDCYTKHHPDNYRKSHWPTHAGIWDNNS